MFQVVILLVGAGPLRFNMNRPQRPQFNQGLFNNSGASKKKRKKKNKFNQQQGQQGQSFGPATSHQMIRPPLPPQMKAPPLPPGETLSMAIPRFSVVNYIYCCVSTQLSNHNTLKVPFWEVGVSIKNKSC